MATSKTIGTPATSTLWAIQTAGPLNTPSAWLPPTQADMAIIQANILDDSVPIATPRVFSGAFIPNQQQLFIPNRGMLQVLPGDWVAVDPFTGWPILISGRAAQNASAWTHT